MIEAIEYWEIINLANHSIFSSLLEFIVSFIVYLIDEIVFVENFIIFSPFISQYYDILFITYLLNTH